MPVGRHREVIAFEAPPTQVRARHRSEYADGGNLEAARQTELDFPPINRIRVEPLIGVLKEVAIKHGHRTAQIAIAWLLKQPVVSTVIVGAKRVEQLHENLNRAAEQDVIYVASVRTERTTARVPLMATPGCSNAGFRSAATSLFS